MQQNLFMGDFIMGQKFIMGDVYYGKCLLWGNVYCGKHAFMNFTAPWGVRGDPEGVKY